MALVTTATLKTARFQSTVAAGTSPLVVASNTLVTNLNADLVDGFEAAALAKLAGAAFTGAVSMAAKLSLGAALDFTGTAAIQEAGVERGRIVGGALRWGTTIAQGSAGEIVVATGKVIGCIDRGGAILLGMRSDPDNDFVLNINTLSTVNSGGYVRIPFGTVPPAGTSGRNGCVGVNEGNHKFYYISGGQRYEVLGTVAA